MEYCYFPRQWNAYFSAQYGTKPIYSDFKSNLGKYISMQNTVGKSAVYSLIVGIILIVLSFL